MDLYNYFLVYLKCFLIVSIVYGLIYLTLLNYELCSFWKKRNIIFYSATSLFNKDLSKSILIQFPQLSKIYSFARDVPICGFFQFRKPTILIKDPHVINAILNSDFKKFTDKRIPGCTDGKRDPLSYHLLALTGERWWRLRTKLTPTFTSEKLRGMFGLLQDRVDGFLAVLRRRRRFCQDSQKWEATSLDVSELCGKLSMDCIAACAFGLELNCLRDKNDVFISMSREAFKPGFWNILKAHLRTLHPDVFGALRLRAYDGGVSDFFRSLVAELVRFKRETGDGRADLVSILMSLLEGNSGSQLEGESSKEDTAKIEDVIAAQVFSFFVGGFETTSITMCNALFEIARNEEVKNNIRNEIKTIIGEDEVTYDKLKKLKYLGYVIDEVLRLYPPVFYVQRVCSEDYRVPGTETVIEKNMEVIVPILELHRDPRYFPRPDSFLPERFAPHSKSAILKGSYLPFGDGPRKCIGYRFSLIELKLALCKVVRDFDFTLDPETPKELSFEEYSRIYRVKHKVLLKFHERRKSF